MQRTEQQEYTRNRNFVTGMFATYLFAVKWIIISIVVGFPALLIGVSIYGTLFPQPVIAAKGIEIGLCQQEFYDTMNPGQSITDPARKYCQVEITNPNGTSYTVSRVVPMTWTYCEPTEDFSPKFKTCMITVEGRAPYRDTVLMTDAELEGPADDNVY